jgi:hypothetical protein
MSAGSLGCHLQSSLTRRWKAGSYVLPSRDVCLFRVFLANEIIRQYRYSSMQAWNADQILLAINYGSDGICFLGSVTRTKRIPSTRSVTEPDAEANDSLPPLRHRLMWISTHFLVSPAISSAPWQLLIITLSSHANGSPTTVCSMIGRSTRFAISDALLDTSASAPLAQANDDSPPLGEKHDDNVNAYSLYGEAAFI